MTGRIDKDHFLAALPCLRRGWYAARVEGAESIGPGLEWRFHVGREVGRLAREWLGPGQLLPRAPADVALEATKAAISAGSSRLLFEPTFETEALIARADAIRWGRDGWELIEVKSGKLPEGEDAKVSQDYIDDLAFTVMVSRAAGLAIERCLLVLISGNYRLGRSPDQLFGELDVTELVLARAGVFEALAPDIVEAVTGTEPPEAELIFACRDCEFYSGDCVGVGVPDPLFYLPGLREKRFDSLRVYGRISSLPTIEDLPRAQQRVAQVIRTGIPLVEPEGLAHLDDVEWPAYYLDFESVSLAIPWFKDTAPYEQIPFQYSIHVCEGPGQGPHHHEYLAPTTGDWRRELAERLVSDLGQEGSILMYSPFERRMLNYLGRIFPDLAARFDEHVSRLFDMEPIFKHGYCHPGFKGRTSIKETLPTMIPDLTYKNLAIRGGTDAAGAFALARVGKRADSEVRSDLLAYCGLDTMAMVRLHEAVSLLSGTRSAQNESSIATDSDESRVGTSRLPMTSPDR